jgi:hypothetical protein
MKTGGIYSQYRDEKTNPEQKEPILFEKLDIHRGTISTFNLIVLVLLKNTREPKE